MNLRLLCSTSPHMTVYFDSWNNWLYVEWAGDVTLPLVQVACLELAQCFVQNSYPRVLNSDIGITSMGWEVYPWLAKHFLPGLTEAGVTQLAWVHAPTVRGRSLAEQVLHQLQHLNIGLFNDVEEATSWLQHTQADFISSCAQLPRPAAVTAQLRQVIAAFARALDTAGVSAVAVPPVPA